MVCTGFIEKYSNRKLVPGKDAKLEQIKKLTHLYLHDNCINQIGDLSACENLQVLYLHNNEIQELKNLHTLFNLKNIYLQKNRIGKIQGLDNLKQLRKLYLGVNEINVLENITNLVNLEELHIEKQILPKGESLYFDPRSILAIADTLVVLNISQNNITSLTSIEPLQKLRVLNASYNKLSDIDEASSSIQKLYGLIELDLAGNPIAKHHHYRETIIANSFRISILDGRDINETTRTFIRRFNHEKSQTHPKNSISITVPDISGDVPPPLEYKVSRAVVNKLNKSVSQSILTTALCEGDVEYVPWKALKAGRTTAPQRLLGKLQTAKKVEKKVKFSNIFPMLP